jgi:hypothetical protein
MYFRKMESVSMVVGRHRAVGIATRYGLDIPGIKSWWGQFFRNHPERPWSSNSFLYIG